MVTSDDSDDSEDSDDSLPSKPKAKRQNVACSSPNAPSQKPYLDTLGSFRPPNDTNAVSGL